MCQNVCSALQPFFLTSRTHLSVSNQLTGPAGVCYVLRFASHNLLTQVVRFLLFTQLFPPQQATAVPFLCIHFFLVSVAHFYFFLCFFVHFFGSFTNFCVFCSSFISLYVCIYLLFIYVVLSCFALGYCLLSGQVLSSQWQQTSFFLVS